MAIRKYKAITPSRRFRQDVITYHMTRAKAPKSLRTLVIKKSGRNNSGKITVRHQGGRQKRFLRVIDFKRSKDGVSGKVHALQYDPNRTAHIALVHYQDGDKRYILAPSGIKEGDFVQAGTGADTKVGNALALAAIPVGTSIHNIEMKPGSGAQMVRSAGTAAIILSKSEQSVIVKLPSGEVRTFAPACKATIGQVGNIEHANEVVGKAGRSRLMGKRPHVRGVAMDPRSHPHGGGEGRSGIGLKHPKSVYGKKTLGVRTRKKKSSDKLIVTRRKK